jgi:putative transposase
LDEGKGKDDEPKQAYGGADDHCAEASGGGSNGGRCAREQDVNKHTIYAWKAKYGGMEVSEAEEVKDLRDENGRLKKLVAELSLDKDMLQSVIRKNSLGSRSVDRKCGACWPSSGPASATSAS